MENKHEFEKRLFRNIWKTKRVTGFEYVQNTLYIYAENCQKYILKSNNIDT